MSRFASAVATGGPVGSREGRTGRGRRGARPRSTIRRTYGDRAGRSSHRSNEPGLLTFLFVALSAAALLGTTSAANAADVDERRAQHDYLLGCAGCHGLDAAGSARVPSLRGIDRLLARPGGRAYVLRVPGVASAPLSDARLAALLEWVFVNFDNHTPTHFTAAEVAAARAAPFVDPKAARAALEYPRAARVVVDRFRKRDAVRVSFSSIAGRRSLRSPSDLGAAPQSAEQQQAALE